MSIAIILAGLAVVAFLWLTRWERLSRHRHDWEGEQ